jgi:hypothetical protein
MKKNLRKILPISILIMISVMALSACQTKTTSPITTTSTTSNYEAGNPQPIDVLSVQGPLPPINPGGPNVEITLKNVSTEPVVSLTAVFTNLGARDIDINFEVGPANPLLPGASVNDTQSLIDGGFTNNVLYPLITERTLQSGATFSYVEQVEISEPPN